jgi:hypothetical protein
MYEDAGCCPPPCRHGWGAHRALGSRVKTSWVAVMNELTTKLRGLEELCSWLEGPGVRIYSLLLKPQPG